MSNEAPSGADVKIDIPNESKQEADVALCRRVFDVFDSEHKGFIDKEGFKTLVNYPDLQSNQKDRLTDAQIEAMLRQIDTSKDGLVSFEEFLKWWQTPAMSAEWALEGARVRAPSQFTVIQRNLRTEEFLENVKRFGNRETYYCALCFEYQLREVGVVLSACHHSYCRQCLSDYLTSTVSDGKVNPTCFHDQLKGGLCGTPMAEEDILALLDEPTRAKYHRFKLNQMDGNHRTCSKCEHTQIGKAQPPQIVCEKCGHKYCFAHGDAHAADVDCTTHERAHAEEERKTKAIISQKCKLCPQCSSPIMKSGGCNHMKCPHCKCSFCWLCLQVIEDIPLPSHYKLDPANPGNTCIGRQMEGMHRADALMGNVHGWRRCVLATFYILLTLVILVLVCPLSFVFTIATVIGCFLCVGRSTRRRMLASPPASFCGGLRAVVREWFSLWSQITCMAFSCICCLPCVLAILICGGCWPATEEQEEDFEGLEVVPLPPINRTCPRRHALTGIRTPHPGFTCDVCRTAQPMGSVVYGCRRCNWDICTACLGITVTAQPDAPASPTTAAAPTSATTTTIDTKTSNVPPETGNTISTEVTSGPV